MFGQSVVIRVILFSWTAGEDKLLINDREVSNRVMWEFIVDADVS